ncbi:MAG: sensor histidine kinase [Lachnospiraceae bacterium]
MKSLKPFSKSFSFQAVQKQLLFVFIMVLLLPTAFCGFLLYNSYSSLLDHYIEQTESDNLRIRSILFDTTTSISNAIENIYREDELLNILNTTFSSKEEAKQAIDHYKSIYKLMYSDTSISSVTIYTFNESVGDYGNFRVIPDEYKNTEWFTTASEKASFFWRSQSRTDIHNNIYWELVCYRRIPLPQTGSYAIICISVSDNYLKSRIDNNTLNNIIAVNENPVFYSDVKKHLGNNLPLEVDYSKSIYSSKGIMNLNDQKVISAVHTLTPLNSDDTLYMISYDNNALKNLHAINQTYILMVIAVIFIPCIIFFIYSKYFSGRISILRKAMYQSSRGNYEIIDDFTGNDELSETFQDLKVMIERIKQKEAEIYEAKIHEQALENRQQQIEFKMLASQINPHFLYNTLEAIRMKAFTANDREVATAIKILGKSLRYVLENTGTVSVSLEKEINHIRNYLQIHRIRFGDRINLIEKIEEDIVLEEYNVLPLLLQPIVENAVIHGLSEKEKDGVITLDIFKNSTFLSILISDNGKGMDKETLLKLKEKIASKDYKPARNIGLYNINQRLQLCYGATCQLHIDSQINKGTSVLMELPLQKITEVIQDESSYCR